MTGLEYLKTLTVECRASINYISQFMVVTDEHVKSIIDHCSKYKIRPNICAWYKDMDDFYSDWTAIGYTKETADRLYKDCKAEFQTFKNGNIIRYVI